MDKFQFRRDDMKKRLLITGMILTIAVVICGLTIFNNMFPKANSIRCPDSKDIDFVSITCNDGEALIVNDTDFEELLLNINSAIPTRKQSPNDRPMVESYYGIVVQAAEEKYYYFVYEEGSRVYIEMPYEGIYKSGEQMIDFVLKYYEE